ncbi:MAG: LacI family DNA-binding transcriptional regulator [Victivallales bacterium]|nr:LacI family DNA-binding transcriptional regulator [Victivallales bacterium]
MCPDDGWLPSFREMRNAWLVSRTVLHRILSEAIQNGLLEGIPRRGFRKRRQPEGVYIDVIACHEAGYMQVHGSVYSVSIDYLWKGLAAMNLMPRFHLVSLYSSCSHYLEIAQLADTRGFILISPCVGEVVATFQETGKPVVLMFPHNRFQGVSQVREEGYTVELQMDYLMKLGHTRILYLREESLDYIDLTKLKRQENYYRLMALNHLKIPKHWHPSYPQGQILDALTLAFSRNPVPTALIVYDRDVPTVYDFLRKRKLGIGTDVSVIATDALPCLNGLSPTVTTVINHEEYSMKCVLSLLARQLQGDMTPVVKEVMLNLKTGQSTGSPTMRHQGG